MKRKTLSAGFTLLEIMVVVVILGILATFVLPNIIGRDDQARDVKISTDIKTIESSLELYRLDNGFYPSTQQGLQALTTEPTGTPRPTNYPRGGYLRSVPSDPWGREYKYTNCGSGRYIVYSGGADGRDEERCS